jgi:uncharacterized protein
MSNGAPTINYIELPGGQLEQTKAFYTAVFGWEWVDYGPTYAASTVDGINIGLNAGATAGPQHEPDAENAIGPLVLFETSDIEATQTGVHDGGGAILSSIYRYPGGRRFHFRDPSWNVLGVYQSDPAS